MNQESESAAIFEKQRKIMRARSQALVVAMLGKQAAESWWHSANLAFDGCTPQQHFETSPEQVYQYLMGHAAGNYQ